jgi:hypothetical protein
MPLERYGSAAELARDVTQAVSGMADAAPGLDTEGATQLISAQPKTNIAATRVGGGEAAATARIPKARAPTPDTPTVAQMPPAAPKKKPVMAIAAAVTVLVVGGGTAALVLSKGGSKEPPSVTQNTAQMAPAGTPSSQPTGNPTRPAGNTATRNPQRTQTMTAQPPDSATRRNEAPTASGIPVSVADADNRLTALMDRFAVTGQTPANIAAASKDTALAYYNSQDVAQKDRAFAAYILANAEGALSNKVEALRWARRAADLAPTVRAYQQMVTDLSRTP